MEPMCMRGNWPPGGQTGWRPSGTEVKQVSVAIVDSSQLFREGLCHLLCKDHFPVTGTARTLVDALGDPASDVSRPELVICGLDADNETAAQLASIGRYRAELPECRVVLLAESMDPILVHRAMASGADALLSKDISGEVLQRSLELVMLGQQLFPASLAYSPGEDAETKPLAEVMPFRSASKVPVAPVRLDQQPPAACSELVSLDQHRGIVLSRRESQVLRCLAAGASNKLIARELSLAEATVKVHVKGLLRKLRLTNRTQAAIWAMSNSHNIVLAPDCAAEPHAAGIPDQLAICA